jgi:hypothetical protein
MSQDPSQSAQERLARTELPLGQWEPLPAPNIIPVSQRPREADFGKALHCLEVLKAVQGDTRTAGWYWGDVRGKAAVGTATAALLNKGLIHSVVGPPPFRLTAKGEEFIETHRKDWEAFLANTDRQGTVEKFANALRQIPEEGEAVGAP